MKANQVRLLTQFSKTCKELKCHNLEFCYNHYKCNDKNDYNNCRIDRLAQLPAKKPPVKGGSWI